MGQAFMKGFLAHGLPRQHLRAADTSPTIRRGVKRQFRIAVDSRTVEAVRGADVVILAVKPQQMAEVVEEIQPILTPRQLVMSIAAGMTLPWLQARLPRQPIVRVMPNLPATVCCGFSAMALGRRASRRHRAVAMALLRSVGEVVELPERYFDAVTAVSGSGPAYVFFLVHVWETAARNLGLPSWVAHRAIRRTLAGSTMLLAMSGEEAHTLMRKVASKGGTTEAALKVLARRRVEAAFVEALEAAARRSKALSWV